MSLRLRKLLKFKSGIPGHPVQYSRPINRPFVRSLFDLTGVARFTRTELEHEEAFLTASLARPRATTNGECRNASDVTSRRALPAPRTTRQPGQYIADGVISLPT